MNINNDNNVEKLSNNTRRITIEFEISEEFVQRAEKVFNSNGYSAEDMIRYMYLRTAKGQELPFKELICRKPDDNDDLY